MVGVGLPQYCEIHLQVFNQVPAVSVRENKTLVLPGGGEEKKALGNTLEHSFS